MKKYEKHFRLFKRFLKENGEWAFIQRQIKNENRSKEDFFRRIEFLETIHKKNPWSLALNRTDILSFSFVTSQSDDMNDTQWNKKWVELATEHEKAQLLLYHGARNFRDVLNVIIREDF